jgi:hypothetical protein
MLLSGNAFDELYGRQIIPNLTVMIRRSVVNEIGQLNEDARLKGNEDYEYWLRISRKYPLASIDRPLAKYRQHAGGISKAGSSDFVSKLYLIDHIDQMFPDVKNRLKTKRLVWKSEINQHLGLALIREGRFGEAAGRLFRAFRLHPWSFFLRTKGYVSRRGLTVGRRYQ